MFARRRAFGVGAVLLAFVMAALLRPPPAAAHAVLEFSAPASGTVLDVAHVPDRVELRFDEPVEAALGALQVLGRDGARVDDGAVRHPAGAGDRVQIGLRHDLARAATWSSGG